VLNTEHVLTNPAVRIGVAGSNYLGSRFAGLYEALPLPHLFAWAAASALSGAALLALFVKRIERLTLGAVRAVGAPSC
jgi:hypothetical protein